MLSLFVRRPGGFSQCLQAFNSNVAPSAYAGGAPYVPLAKNATEQYVIFDGIAPAAGTLKFTVYYTPSASNGGDVVFEADYVKTSLGGDPSGSITTQSSFTFTPGTGAVLKSVTHATLQFTVAKGDHVLLKITRKNSGSDTHTGSMNVMGVEAELV